MKNRSTYSPRIIDLTKSCKTINREREMARRRRKYHMIHHIDNPDTKRCSICQNDMRRLRSRDSYYREVWRLTEIEYKAHIQTINPTRIHRGSLYHLDHIYSIKEGYTKKVKPAEIASRHNLRLIDRHSNLSKGDRCDISLQELRRRIAKG